MSGVARVSLAQARGSVPREAGVSMTVWEDTKAVAVPWSGGWVRARISGTIGGGALEAEAIGRAVQCLHAGAGALVPMALGPTLGQCCGGAVVLDISLEAKAFHDARPPVWIWGAGHVGRALVGVLAPLGAFDITWIDTSADRFPAQVPEGVSVVPTAEPALLMARAPKAARHFVMTYSHELDLALCHAGLTRGFASLGLIGSATKWARFRTRLGALGHTTEAIAQITCPIGDPGLGKHPQAIAVGVVAGLLSRAEQGETVR